MEHTETLKPYVKDQLNIGTPVEQIKSQLVERGWDPAVVEQAVLEVQNEAAATAPPAEPAPEPVSVDQPTTVEPVGTDSPAATSPSVQNTEPQPEVIAPKSKYKFSDAVRDSVAAVKANTAAVVVMMVIGLALMLIAYGVIFVLSMVAFLGGAMQSGSGFIGGGYDGSRLLGSFLMILVVAVPLMILANAFNQSIIGLAINDGADGIKSSFGRILLNGLKRTLRVALATLIFSTIAFAPMILASVIGTLSGSGPVAALLSLVGIIVTLLLVLRLIILPTVALLEPETPLLKLFSRTRYLMGSEGTVFALKTIFTVAVLNFVISLSLSLVVNSFGETFSGVSLVVTMLIYAVMYLVLSGLFVVYYRNRRALKG